MSTSPPTPKGSRKAPIKDRRSAPGAKDTTGSLRRLKGLLARPLGLERRGGQLHVVFVDRRQPPPPVDEPPSPSQLCAELSARLLAHEPDHADRMMRHLVLVHDALGRKGWPGVGALPGPVLREALAQTEMLASEEPSPYLEQIIEQLRSLQPAADLRDDRDSRLQDFRIGENVEVTESDYAEFDDIERSWVGTVPSGLVPPKLDE